MNKERAAQIAEKDAIKYEQMVIMLLFSIFLLYYVLKNLIFLIMFSMYFASFRQSKVEQSFENYYIS